MLRKRLILKDEINLRIAEEVSLNSKDTTKIGAYFVTEDNVPLSLGWNGFPRRIEDLEERYSDRETKLKYVCHAEVNAIYNATLTGVSLKNSTLYVYGLPVCEKCCLAVAQVGTKRVVMRYKKLAEDSPWKHSFEFTESVFNEAGIKFECIEV